MVNTFSQYLKKNELPLTNCLLNIFYTHTMVIYEINKNTKVLNQCNLMRYRELNILFYDFFSNKILHFHFQILISIHIIQC